MYGFFRMVLLNTSKQQRPENASVTNTKPSQERRCDCSGSKIFLPSLLCVTFSSFVVSHVQEVFQIVSNGCKLDYIIRMSQLFTIK